MAPCRARSIGGLWALGPPTTAAQNLAELLLRVCGCRYVILMVARFKSSVEGRGQTWQFGADGQRPSTTVGTPIYVISLCWPHTTGKHLLISWELGTQSTSNHQHGVTIETSTALICDGAVVGRASTSPRGCPETPGTRRVLQAHSPSPHLAWSGGTLLSMFVIC